MRARKSVYLNIRITRAMAERIWRLERARQDRSTADTCRDLMEEGLRQAEIQGEVASKKRRTGVPHSTPPPAVAEQPPESESKVAA